MRMATPVRMLGSTARVERPDWIEGSDLAVTSAHRRAGGPFRTCVGCRRVAPSSELVRVVASEEGRLALRRAGHGRGAWLCGGSPECLVVALRRHAFDRALRRQIVPEAGKELAARLETAPGMS
ncbi:MAG: YlxR family protein [Acidimicrobiales bacterium]